CKLPANLISMGAIDFGILVDGAVVLVENVMHEAREARPQTQADMRALVVGAAFDVGRPTVYAMSIIIAALIPVFSLERVEGRIFRPVALTYSFALVSALVLAFTLVPALCALLLKPHHFNGEGGGEPRVMTQMRARYARAIDSLVRRPGRVVVAIAALF